jgi:HK97 family phage portal protein
MGLLDNLRNLIFKQSQATAEKYNRAIYNYLGNSIVWNAETDDTYINEGYRKNSTIYSLVNIITKAAGIIPFQIYEKTNDNNFKRYKSLTSGMLDNSTIQHIKLLRKNSMIELEDTELHELLNRPNPAQSYNSFITELIAFGLLTGNRYIYGIGPDTGVNLGKYSELYILPSQKMEIISGGLHQPIKEYALQYNGTYKIPAEEICHIKDFNPYYDGSGSNLYGQSPLKAGLRSMTTNNEAVETGVKYLQNQTARGILTTQEEDGISELQAQQLKDKFRQAHQGSSNAGDILISPKKMSWVNFGLNASDLSLIEQYNASIKDLANIYNVPVQLLNNTDSSSYNNMKEAKKALYQNAVIPQLIKVRDELNRWLAPKYGDKLCIDFDFTSIAELQEETEKVVEQMSKSWWLTPNEKREAMNYGIIEDNPQMDDFYIPQNLMSQNGTDFVLPDVEIPETPIENETEANEEIKAKVPNLPDAYTTQAEAEARAEQLGGSGYHTHEYDGETIYMPFETHEEYENALEENKYHYGKPHDDDDKKMLTKEETFDNYPQSATNNAKRMIAWKEKYKDEVKAGTRVGWTRASQLANRKPLSLSILKRTKSFLARHKKNSTINPKFRDTPWKDKGYVAYNIWGGESMRKWVNKLIDRLDNA